MHRTLTLSLALLAACGGGGGGESAFNDAPLASFATVTPSTDRIVPRAVASLSDDRIIAGGHFRGLVSFGGTSFLSDDLAGFLVCLDRNGAPEWAQAMESTNPAFAEKIARRGDDSVVVAVRFETDLTLARGTPQETTLEARDGTALACYAADGTLLWASTAIDGDRRFDARGLAAFPDGSVLLVGVQRGSSTFGPGSANETTVSCTAGKLQSAVARYHPNGALDWGMHLGACDSTSFASACGILPNGDIVVAGVFADPLEIAPGTTLTPTGTQDDGYVVGLDGNGAVQWVRHLAGETRVLPGDIAVRADGSFVLSGTAIGGHVTFDHGRQTASRFELATRSTYWVSAHGSDGALLWMRRIAPDVEGAFLNLSALVADGEGGCVLFAYGRDGMVASPGREDEIALPDAEGALCLVGYDRDGNLAWARRDGGETQDGFDGDLASDGSAVVIGTSFRSVTIGAGGPNETTFPAPDGGGSLALIARYLPDGSFAPESR